MEWMCLALTYSCALVVGDLIRMCVPAMHPMTSGKPAMSANFAFCRSACCWDGRCTHRRMCVNIAIVTLCMVLEAVDRLTPIIRPTMFWKHPVAKKRRVSRSCRTGDSEPWRATGYSMSSLISSTIDRMCNRRNLNLENSSSSSYMSSGLVLSRKTLSLLRFLLLASLRIMTTAAILIETWSSEPETLVIFTLAGLNY